MARFSNPFSQFFSDSGRILPGAQLFFYVNGTTTPQATYEDAAFTVVNPNPVICGTNGRVPDIFMPDNLVYSITLTDTNGVQIDQADDITGSDSQVSSEDVIAALTANTDPVVINGSSATINANTTVNGNQTITGTLGVTGSLTASGGVDGVLGGVTPADASVTAFSASGASTFPNDTTIDASGFIRKTDDSNALILSGGSSSTSGPNIQLRGPTAASNPNQTLFRNGGTNWLEVDSSGSATFSDDVTVSGALAIGAAVELTVSSGAVTVTGSRHSIDTEGNAPTDDLTTINGGVDGQIAIFSSVTGARDTTFKDGTGNLELEGDFTLSDARDSITLCWSQAGNYWFEISRSNNN